MENIINALKSILVIEFDRTNMRSDYAIRYMNEIKQYVENEMGITHNMSYNDPSLVVLVFPSDKLNIQLINSPYDACERFEDTLSERFNNIEEFIHELYRK